MLVNIHIQNAGRPLTELCYEKISIASWYYLKYIIQAVKNDKALELEEYHCFDFDLRPISICAGEAQKIDTFVRRYFARVILFT